MTTENIPVHTPSSTQGQDPFDVNVDPANPTYNADNAASSVTRQQSRDLGQDTDPIEASVEAGFSVDSLPEPTAPDVAEPFDIRQYAFDSADFALQTDFYSILEKGPGAFNAFAENTAIFDTVTSINRRAARLFTRS